MLTSTTKTVPQSVLYPAVIPTKRLRKILNSGKAPNNCLNTESRNAGNKEWQKDTSALFLFMTKMKPKETRHIKTNSHL